MGSGRRSRTEDGEARGESESPDRLPPPPGRPLCGRLRAGSRSWAATSEEQGKEGRAQQH